MVIGNKLRYLLLLILAAATAYLAWYFFRPIDNETAIRKVLSSVVSNITKVPADGTTNNIAKSHTLPHYFTDSCHVSIGLYIESVYFTQEAITNNSMLIRTIFKFIQPSISNVIITIDADGGKATADFSASVKAGLNNGEQVKGEADLICKLIRANDQWQISSIDIRDVLEK